MAFARERCGEVERLFNYLLTNVSIDVNKDFVGSSQLSRDINLFPKFVVTHRDGGEAMGHGVESCHLMRIGTEERHMDQGVSGRDITKDIHKSHF